MQLYFVFTAHSQKDPSVHFSEKKTHNLKCITIDANCKDLSRDKRAELKDLVHEN